MVLLLHELSENEGDWSILPALPGWASNSNLIEMNTFSQFAVLISLLERIDHICVYISASLPLTDDLHPGFSSWQRKPQSHCLLCFWCSADFRSRRWNSHMQLNFFHQHPFHLGCASQRARRRKKNEQTSFILIVLLSGMVFRQASPWQQGDYHSPLRLLWGSHFFWLPWSRGGLGCQRAAVPEVGEICTEFHPFLKSFFSPKNTVNLEFL